ncbi:MAG: hypothetical protein ACOX6V_03385 [Patescibacteria group bacterium]|jgi:hypothetical protein
MRPIIHIVLSLALTLLIVPFFILVSLPISLSKEPTKQLLQSVKVYEFITPVIQTRSIQHLSEDNSFYSQVLEKHVEEIITPEWIKYLGETLIDEGYSAILSNRIPSDVAIDITLLKNNYLGVLERTNISDLVPRFQTTLPDTIPLTILLEINSKELQSIFRQLQSIVQSAIFIAIALGLTLILTFTAISLLLSKEEILSLIATSFITGGTLLTLTPFIFHFVILSPFGLQFLLSKTIQLSESFFLTLGLLLLEKTVSVWLWVGLSLLMIGFLLRLFYLLKFDIDKA